MTDTDTAGVDRRYVALFGPSYVGKTTFLSWLVSRPDFLVAPLITDRPARRLEQRTHVTMSIVDGDEFDRRTQTGSWMVFHSSGHRYALDLSTAAVLLERAHVVLGVAPSLVDRLHVRMPHLVRVLFWPTDFDAMQDQLLRCPHRTDAEKASRHVLNERMRRHPPPADVVLRLPRVAESVQLEYVHRRLAARLRAALASKTLAGGREQEDRGQPAPLSEDRQSASSALPPGQSRR